MRLFSWYVGGAIPECWSSRLSVEGGRLFGRHNNEWQEIRPQDIVGVVEYTFNNPFVLVRTVDGQYHVGALTRHYDVVVAILCEYAGDEFCRTLSHRVNVILYRRRISIRSVVVSTTTLIMALGKRIVTSVFRRGRHHHRGQPPDL